MMGREKIVVCRPVCMQYVVLDNIAYAVRSCAVLCCAVLQSVVNTRKYLYNCIINKQMGAPELD